MVDVWRWWDEEVKDCGRPDTAAAELTDAQLLALLRDETDHAREVEKRVIADEIMNRLRNGRLS